MSRPTLIVGAGLAAMHLAWALEKRGLPFQIAGFDLQLPAWRASAGIINPVTGKRVVKSWQIDTLLPFAAAHYAACAAQMRSDRFFHNIPLRRYFRGDSDEPKRLRERLQDPAYAAYLDSGAVDARSFAIQHAAWVDVAGFVAASRTHFADLGKLDNTLMSYEGASTWQRAHQGHVVFCEGASGEHNPWFDWLDYRISRGDVIDLDLGQPAPDHLVNREKWLLPLAAGHARLGSTYTWDHLLDPPDPAQGTALLTSLADLVPQLDGARITAHHIGIRPGTNDSKPYVGQHPSTEPIYILNGFGSKGASQSPWCADVLAEHLASGAPIPKEVDVQRRLKFARNRVRQPEF